ncbi:hypothetical protein WJX79_005951 [Trebouxia sp. C0005]
MLQLDLQQPLPASTGRRQLQSSSRTAHHGMPSCSQQHIQKRSKPCRPHSTPARAQAQAQAEAPLAPVEQEPSSTKKNITWDTLGFGLEHVAPTMYVAEWSPEQGWKGELRAYGPLQLDPSAQVLNYAYFKGGQMTPIDLVVEEHFHRAAPGGMGGTKAAGNYSPVLTTQLAAKQNGYADVVYLDAKTDTYLEEVSSCNIFTVKGRHIKTPPLQGTILPGITRRSILELAESRGYTVEEAPITLEEALQADEVFTSGTAVVVSPVGSLTHKGQKTQFGKPGVPGPVATELYGALTDVQQEKVKDSYGWVFPVT